MGALLSGLIGAAGADIEKQADIAYKEKRQERADRMKILELAISNPNYDINRLPKDFGELEDIAKDVKYKNAPDYPGMAGMVQKIFHRRKQQQQQQAGQQQAQADVQGAPGVTAQPQPQPQQQQQSPAGGQQMTAPPPPSRFLTREQQQGLGEQEYQTGRKRVRTESEEGTKTDEAKADELTGYFKSAFVKQGMDEKAAEKAAREEADLIVFKKGKTPAGHNMTQVLYKKPGSDEPITGWADPREPGVVFDSATGQRLEPGSFTVVDKTLASTEARGKYWGEFGNYYRAMRGRGLNDEGAKRAAGDMIAKKYGVQIGKAEQQQAIDQAAFNIAPGPGLPASARAPAQPSTQQSPTQPPAQTGAPVPQNAVTPPLPPRRTAPPAAGGSPLTGGGMTQREQDDVLFYLGTLTGTQKGGGKAGLVRSQNGLRTIARTTGLDPMTLTSRLSETPALAKQIGETVQRSGAIQRLNNTIEKHGKILIGTTAKLRNSGSPFINKPLREWARQASGDPDYKRFIVAINEVQREYAYLTAGGAQSRAMLPVHTNESMEAILSKDSTPEEIAAAVNQISIGAQTEQQAMDKTVQDLQQKMLSGPGGQATGASQQAPLPAANAPKIRILGIQ